MKLKPKLKTVKRDSPDYSDVMKMIKPVGALPFNLSMITYGRSGTGKTTFAASFPKPALLLNIKEDGTDSISDTKGVDIIRIATWDEFEQVYWFLKTGKHQYKTVIMDAVTQLQDLAIDKIKGNKSDDDVLSQRLWGQVSSSMKKWLIDYRDLINDNKIEAINFICHDRVNESEDGGAGQLDPEVGPRLMPSVSSYLCGSVKVIGYTFIKEVKSKDPTKKSKETNVEYRMRLGPNPYYITKVRRPKTGVTPDSIFNPSYDKIIEIMKGNYKKELPVKKSPSPSNKKVKANA